MQFKNKTVIFDCFGQVLQDLEVIGNSVEAISRLEMARQATSEFEKNRWLRELSLERSEIKLPKHRA